MRGIRVVAATGLALAVAASTAHAQSGVALDGRKKTHATYTATLTGPAAKPGTDRIRTDVLTPTLADCSSTSCDITSVRLTVPRGTSAGRLTVTFRVAKTMNAYVALYDGKGAALKAVDLVGQASSVEWQNRQVQDCCTTQYVLDFTEERIRPGTYQVVVFNRGGAGSFVADLEFKAHPADRRRS